MTQQRERGGFESDRSCQRPGLGALIAMESMKLVYRPVVRVTLALLAGGSALITLMAYMSTRASNLDAANQAVRLQTFIMPHGLMESFAIASRLSGILLVVVAAALIGSEFSWGTIKVMVSSGASRSKLFFAKLITLLSVVVVYLTIGVIAGSVASVIDTISSGNALTFGTVNGAWLADASMAALRSSFVIGVLAILAFAVSGVARSLMAGVAAGIGWIVLEQVLHVFLSTIGNVGLFIDRLLILSNISALMQRNGFGPQRIEPHTPSELAAFSILILYSLALIAIAYIAFTRRDIQAGS
jgi:ABC-2 type transport system permease protein